jgi:hypothetical protein
MKTMKKLVLSLIVIISFPAVLIVNITSSARAAVGLSQVEPMIAVVPAGVIEVAPEPHTETTIADLPIVFPAFDALVEAPAGVSQPVGYGFGNPAGCSTVAPAPEEMLANVQAALGNSINLAERRQDYIWNGPVGGMVDVSADPFAYEFVFNEYQHPLTYRGDRVATTFLNNGFVIWFRVYGGNFRLLVVPMIDGVAESRWGGYVAAYWEKDGQPADDRIYPVMKKLPCHWAIEQGYVSHEILHEMFDLDWGIPDYLGAGRQYLASTCKEANQVSREKIDYWDATSMCGPLAWTIMKDVNGFPYRIGSWSANAGAFTAANPRWNAQPWGTFDPETFDLIRTDTPMPGYDFEKHGNLYPGDVIYSFATLYQTPGYFDHIFLVAGLGENGERLSISNMVRNHPYADCSIDEVVLYTPGDRKSGVINHEWNGFGFGRTGTTGFDVFRWKWVSFHAAGQPQEYVVRPGDTIETIAFDWKIHPQQITSANQLSPGAQLQIGQIIILPVVEQIELHAAAFSN